MLSRKTVCVEREKAKESKQQTANSKQQSAIRNPQSAIEIGLQSISATFARNGAGEGGMSARN